MQGLPHAILEIRQDLIGNAAGQAAWVQRLAEVLPPLLVGDEMQKVQFFGSRTDPDYKM